MEANVKPEMQNHLLQLTLLQLTPLCGLLGSRSHPAL